MSTIKEVAQLANVSVTTVSRVINNNGYVHDDTRKVVLASMEELNFNSTSIYKKGKHGYIGIIIKDKLSINNNRLIEKIEYTCLEKGYKSILGIIRNIKSLEDYYLYLFKKYNVKLIIMVDPCLNIDKFTQLGTPIINLTNIDYPNLPSIKIDITEALLNVTPSIGSGTYIIKYKHENNSYLDQIESTLIKKVIKYSVIEINRYNNSFLDSINNLSKFDTFIAYNDFIALSIVNQLNKKGNKVPDDFKIIGIENSNLSNIITPRISSLDYPINDIIDKLSYMIDNYNIINNYVLSSSFIIKDSI